MAWGAPRGVDDLIAKLRDNTTVGLAGSGYSRPRRDCEIVFVLVGLGLPSNRHCGVVLRGAPDSTNLKDRWPLEEKHGL